MGCPGGLINIEFVSTDATTASPLGLYTANGGAYTLRDGERVLIDRLHSSIASGAGDVLVFDDVNGNGAANAGERIAVLSNVANEFDGGKEGASGGRNRVPSVIASAAGAVTITGVGRILADGGLTTRPDWREDKF